MSAISIERGAPRDEPAEPPPRPRQPPGWLPFAVLGALMVAASVVLMYHGRDTTFYFDDWDFVLERRGWSPHVLLYAHNEHFSIVPVFVYKILLELFGMDAYGVFRAALVLCVLLCAGLVFEYARRRVDVWVGVGLAACIMFMGIGSWDIIWAFQLGFVSSLTAGVAALLVLDRPTRRNQLLAAALLCVSLGSTSLGVCFCLAVGLDLALAGRLRSLWVAGGPLALFALWYVQYGTSTGRLDNVPDIPAYVLDGLDDSAGALVGIAADWGQVLVAAVAFVIARRLARPGPVPARLVATAALPLLFFGLAGFSRAHMGVEADTGRYLFPGGVLFALAAVEALQGTRLTGRGQALALGALLAGALAGSTYFAANADQLRALSGDAKAALAAVELVGANRLNPAAQPVANQPQVEVGTYFAALDEYGSSPAWSEAELARAPGQARAAADTAFRNLLGSLGPLVRPVTRPRLPAACRPVSGATELAVPPRGLVVSAADAPVKIQLRRFASAFPKDPTGEVGAQSASVLRLPPDRASRAWTARLSSDGQFRACAA